MNTIIERIIEGKYFYAVISAVLGLIPLLMSLLCYHQSEKEKQEIIVFACFGGLLVLGGVIDALWIRLHKKTI